MTKKEALKLKKGDRVKLLSTKKSKLECENWLSNEKTGTNRSGKVFTIKDVSWDAWLYFKGCTYGHPYNKFKKVRKSPGKKRKK